ncbi:MAG: hypothetical protein IJH61_05045 [Eubacteriaceae bacterium]|nr:hypothetical protein [Eubacteriaceae bacterium]
MSVNTGDYQGIDTASPDWVAKLDAAKSSDQILTVAAYDEKATDAWIALHEKKADGKWHMVMTTPGFIGKKRPWQRQRRGHQDPHRRIQI